MKPYNELTRLGRLRRLRKLAETALDAYGIADANLTFQHYGGNVIFRVDVPGAVSSLNECEYYVPNRYNLRILTMNDPHFTQSELTWLATLRDVAGLPVPEPVPTLDGQLLTTIATPGVPQGKVVSLMRWVDGRLLPEKKLGTHHAFAWGQLTGRLHRFAASWNPPEDFKRFQWDWDGLFGNSVLRIPVDELVASMPVALKEPFIKVSKQIKDIMKSFGKGPDVYGLIHSDMFLENVLFKAGEPRLIDFEDCGFGYWMLDIGIVLSQFRWMEKWLQIRDAFLEGYAGIHTLPVDQLEQLDLFMAAPHAINVLWASAFIQEDPAMTAENEEWRTYDGEKLLRMINQSSGSRIGKEFPGEKMDKINKINRERWNALASANVEFSRPFLDFTPEKAAKYVYRYEIIKNVAGKNVLCLASGGGQDSAAFGLLGSIVTVMDLSDIQLERDRVAAEFHKLQVTTVQGDMRDLSAFTDNAFDLVWQPYSVNFIPSVETVYREVARVLKPGGIYFMQFANPFVHTVDDEAWDGTSYPLNRPYIDGEDTTHYFPRWDVTQEDGSSVEVDSPHEFRHNLSTILNTMAQNGFVFLYLQEYMLKDEKPEPGSWSHFTQIAPPWFDSFWRLEPVN